jgi:alpha-beta hydrolase superfamily lysophospholipase
MDDTYRGIGSQIVGCNARSRIMLSLRRSAKTRYGLFIPVGAVSLTLGWVLCGFSLAAVFFAVLPTCIAYIAMIRPGAVRRVRYYHVLYAILLAAMVPAYFVLLTKAIPQLRVRWLEIPIALWFLLTLHIVVWLLDRLVNAILSIVFSRIGAKPQDAEQKTPILRHQPAGVARAAIRVLCVLALAGPYVLALFMVHWVKFSDNSDPMQQYGSAFEPARIEAVDGVHLDGWFIPSLPVPSEETVILVPGRGTAKVCFLNYAQVLCLNGYNVLLFDLRGEGGSSGHSRSFGLEETRDVLGAVRFLERSHPEVSSEIYVLGISYGAAAAIRAAAADTRIRAVVVDSPMTATRGDLSEETMAWLPSPVRAYVDWMTTLFASAELGCNLLAQSDLADEIAKLSPRPVLIVQGLEDRVVKPTEALRLYDAAGQPKDLCTVPRAGHAQALTWAGDIYVSRILKLFARAREQSHQ